MSDIAIAVGKPDNENTIAVPDDLFMATSRVTTVFEGPAFYIVGDGEKQEGSINITITVPDNTAVVNLYDSNGKTLKDAKGRPFMIGMEYDPVNRSFTTIGDYSMWLDDLHAVDGNLNDADNRRTTGIFWDYRDDENRLDGGWDVSLPDLD